MHSGSFQGLKGHNDDFINDHLDVGRVSQGGVVRFPGLGWSSEKEEGA